MFFHSLVKNKTLKPVIIVYFAISLFMSGAVIWKWFADGSISVDAARSVATVCLPIVFVLSMLIIERKFYGKDAIDKEVTSE